MPPSRTIRSRSPKGADDDVVPVGAPAELDVGHVDAFLAAALGKDSPLAVIDGKAWADAGPEKQAAFKRAMLDSMRKSAVPPAEVDATGKPVVTMGGGSGG